MADAASGERAQAEAVAATVLGAGKRADPDSSGAGSRGG